MARNQGMEEEFLSCYICYDIFQEPKTLTCLHRFCEKCIHNYILGLKTSTMTKQGGFHCPVCREFIKSPDTKRPPSDWAALLKTDFHLKSLIRFVESQPALKSHNLGPTLDHPCKDHKDKERDLFCVDCSQIICHLCAGISHRGCDQVITLSKAAADLRISAGTWMKRVNSKMKDISSLEKTREKFLNGLERQKAEAEAAIIARGKEITQLVMKTEQELLKHLNEEYANLQEKIALKSSFFDEKISLFKGKVGEIASNFDSVSDYDLLTSDSPQKILGGLEDHDIRFKQYNSFIQNLSRVKIAFQTGNKPIISLGDVVLRAQTDDSAPATQSQQSHNGEKVSLFNRIRGITTRLQSANVVEEAEKVFSHTTPVEVLPPPTAPKPQPPTIPRKPDHIPQQQGRFREGVPSSLKTAPCTDESGVQKVRSLTVAQENPRSRTSSLNASTPNRVHYAAKDHGQMPSVSLLTGNATAASAPTATGNAGVENRRSQNESREESSKTLVETIRTIRASFREDEYDPLLRDVIVLSPANTVVVTDWANSSVKAFFVRRDRDCRLTVGGRPWAITRLTEASAAISLPHSQQICILKITPVLMVQNSIVTSKKYSGLATLSSSLLVASGGSGPPAVDIITIYGEVLKSFSHGVGDQPLFEYPAYVSVTPGSQIIVSDRRRGSITCLSHTGEVKFTFLPEGARRLREPSGLVIDSSGRTLVAESRGVICLSSDGHFERPLLRPQDGLVDDPRGVTLDTDGNMYVTSNNDTVSVFKLRRPSVETSL